MFLQLLNYGGKQCGAGKGTNTKEVELMGVWATLTIAHHLSYPKLQILGDSKVVID
jgi:ribonuclease HI